MGKQTKKNIIGKMATKQEKESVNVKGIIETLFETYDTDKSDFLEESEVRCLLKDLYDDMGQGTPDEETIQGFMGAAGALGKFTKESLVELLSPIFEEGLGGEDEG